MVILDTHNSRGLPSLRRNLKDEPKLVVQPHRPLMTAFALEFLVMKALHRVKRSLIDRCTNNSHHLAVSANNIDTKADVVRLVDFESLQFSIDVPDVHQVDVTLTPIG